MATRFGKSLSITYAGAPMPVRIAGRWEIPRCEATPRWKAVESDRVSTRKSMLCRHHAQLLKKRGC